MFIGRTGSELKLIHYFCAMVNAKQSMMKNIKNLFCLSVFLSFAVLGGCSSNDADNAPGDVAVTLYTALTSGDADAVKKHLYISNKQQRETFFKYLDIAVASQQYKENTQGYVPQYSVDEVAVDGDKADVILVGKGPLGQSLRITAKMLKVDGVWMVDGDHGVWQKNN